MTSHQSDEETGLDIGKFEFQTSATASKKGPHQLGKASLSRQPRPPQGGRKPPRPKHSGKDHSVTTTSSHIGDSDYLLQPPAKFENTYRTTPHDGEKFNVCQAKGVIQKILDHYMQGVRYEPEHCAELSKNLTEVIKNKIKELEFPRYKYVCSVSIGQNCDQGINFVSRSVWNQETDNFTTVTYKDNNIFVVATIFATYFE